ncbi:MULTISPECIES: hypothetical protein [unclassified Bradyrhizobium]|uniref:hypothetical protein n=1 Tax=unclassified Bradyrhizobium TaxID=2631580 RepID=UPI00247AF59A|nr:MULTISPECIES: hypothetical protein [unclassified Bradyrhizobium]WGS18673.1 hypothetical protein MTX22_29565 [Bradyrhizobium sp. ISRA463]WGS25496.1 hypothetical protein MTX19_27145 [Bradyrhizobium sp. ISRA464]
MAWVFHGGIFSYGVQRYIYEARVLEHDKARMISDAQDIFLAGFERLAESSADGGSPIKVAG